MMRRSIVIVLFISLFLSLCLLAHAQEETFIGEWRCVSFDYEGLTYDTAAVAFEFICLFREDGTAEYNFDGDRTVVSWHVENGAPVITDGAGDHPFMRDGDALLLEDEGVITRLMLSVAQMDMRCDLTYGGGTYSGAYTGYTVGGKPWDSGGTFIYDGGGIYRGGWNNGLPFGQGKMTWPDGSVYTGNWNEGSRNGLGVFTWPNGDQYEGAFTANAMNGQGKYTWTSGYVYIGDWAGNQMNGDGTLYGAEGQIIQQGEWKNGEYVAAADPASETASAARPSATYNGSPLGSAKRLEGRNLLVTIFVDIEGYEWAWEDFEAIRGKYVLAKTYLEAEAGRYGKELELIYDFETDPDLIYKITMTEDYFAAFTNMSVTGAGVSAGDVTAFTRFLGTIKLLNDYIEEQIPYRQLCAKYETDSIAYCFQVKKWAPACFEFFYNPDILPSSSYHEKFILFDLVQWGADTLPHELLHTFGAVDLYLPSAVNGVSDALVSYAGTHYPNDIMMGSGGMQIHDSIPYEVGPLTAYAIGWLDDIPEAEMFPGLKRHTVAAFYDHTRHVDPSLITAGALPASGGSVRIDGVTDLAFTPDHSDIWIVTTTDCGPSKVLIEIYDSRMNSLGGSRMGGGDTEEGGRNVCIYRWLNAGESYVIQASFADAGVGDNAKGSYTVTVSNPEPFPSGGGKGYYINGFNKVYTFTPEATGVWEFVHSEQGDAEVFYMLYAEAKDGSTNRGFGKYADQIGEAWPGTEGYDEYIAAYLEAGQTYILELRCMANTSSYTITVTKTD